MKSSKMLLFGIIMGIASLTGCQQHQCFDFNFPHCASCADIHQPVCGCNGVTYSNPCEAECRGIKYFTYGECNGIKME